MKPKAKQDYLVVQKGAKPAKRDGWREVPFSEAVQINPAVQLERGAVYPFVDMAAVTPDSRSTSSTGERGFKGSGSRFQSGDTLMARITPCLENGKIARYQAMGDKQKAHGSTEFIVIRGRSGVTDNDFAYYLTQWEEVRNYAIGQMTGTSGRQRVPVDCLDHLEIPLPPLPEQQAIAHILGTLDDKIELNRRMNQTLEEMARAIFKSWFVDFDPVRAKMEGRDAGLPPDLAALFPDRLVDSELGQIPEGWAVKPLGEVIEIHDNKRIPLNNRQRAERQGAYPYYGAAGIMDYVDDYLFDGVYVLVGEDGSVVNDEGYPVVQYVWGQFWVNNHAHVLRAKHGVGLEQLYLFLKQTNIVPYVTGAVQPKLSQTNLCSVPFSLPSQAVSLAFADIAGSLFQQIRRIADESHTLAAQRDTLLPRLVSGEIFLPCLRGD